MGLEREWPVLVLRVDSTGAVNATGPDKVHLGRPGDEIGAANVDLFVDWFWDGACLVVQTDRYGFFPLFYHEWDGGIMVSPSVTALIDAGAPVALDTGALAVLLRLGFLVGDDTPFAGIRSLPAGGQMTWSPGRHVTRSSPSFAARREISRCDAVDAYIDLFRAAVHRRPARSASVVPLSGGRDSRHIFLELCASGRPPDVAVTIGSPGGYSVADVETARELALRTDVRHVVLPLPASRWDAQMQTVRATNFCTVEHWWFEPLVAFLRELGGEATVYEGVAGDVLSTDFLKSTDRQRLYEGGKLHELADILMGSEGYLPAILPHDLYKDMGREVAADKITTELAAHADAPNPLASFFFYNRTRRVTAFPPASLFGEHAEVWCPYLDTDLVTFLSSLPAEILKGESNSTLHDDAILRGYPRFADIPFAKKYPTRSPLLAYERKTVIDMAREAGTTAPTLIRGRFLWPRIVRGILDPFFCVQASELAPITSYLTQLSRAAETRE